MTGHYVSLKAFTLMIKKLGILNGIDAFYLWKALVKKAHIMETME